jgi:hypothetical protein
MGHTDFPENAYSGSNTAGSDAGTNWECVDDESARRAYFRRLSVDPACRPVAVFGPDGRTAAFCFIAFAC